MSCLLSNVEARTKCNSSIENINDEENEQREARAKEQEKKCVQYYYDCPPTPTDVVNEANRRRMKNFFKIPEKKNPAENDTTICIDPRDPPDPDSRCGPT